MEGEDRISELPEHFLQNHILSLLPQDDAVRTCILSKSWRHLGPARPKIEFHERDFRRRGIEEKFISFVENTLQSYADQKLPIQEFILELGFEGLLSNKPFSVLVKKIVNLLVLKRLELHFVYINDKTLKKIMSRCPLIEHLVLSECPGLTRVKVNKARYLKHLRCVLTCGRRIEINDDAPSLETIRIGGGVWTWFHIHNNYFFPRLKSLYLSDVKLRTEWLNNLSSNNCPCLEELELHFCSGLREFNLSNRSIKRLVIDISNLFPIESATIDAANMLHFELRSAFLPSIISFATTSKECKSLIMVGSSFSSADDVSSSSTWYHKLHEFLRAIRQSQISLNISYLPELTTTNQESAYDDGGISEPPVVVEHLYLSENYPYSALPELLNCLFRICRPRYINLLFCSQIKESLWKTIVNKGETTQCDFWQQDLEESSIQVWDKNANEWRPVQVCEFSNNLDFRFRLKWREI